MKVTVWGGAGLLGSPVCDVLSENGHDVTIADIQESSWQKEWPISVDTYQDLKKVEKAIGY